MRPTLSAEQKLTLFENPGSFLSQYMLWRRADIVLAAHGGALANLVWVKETTGVIEFLPVLSEERGRRARMCYASLAGSLGLNYVMLPIEAEQFNGPLKVPPSDLQLALSMLKEKSK